MIGDYTITVVLPCFKTRDKVLDVITRIPACVDHVIVVDDKCPENTGQHVEQANYDNRVQVIYNSENLGVGGAVKRGYQAAVEKNNSGQIIVKCDSDGQMDPAFIPTLVQPIIAQMADYTKGNRFFFPEDVTEMPAIRLVGNAALSFFSKISTGYWNIFDPTNGFTAIHSSSLKAVPLEKISDRYFFETDMLFRLGLAKAVVSDVPMKARYADEKSSMRISRILFEFLGKHGLILTKRLFYVYVLREFSIASLLLVFGTVLFLFGMIFGGLSWHQSSQTDVAASAGTVMLSSLPLILGFQMLVAFLGHDYGMVPRTPLQVLTREPSL